MSAKHTPGPWQVIIDGTDSARWPFIVRFDDENTDSPIAELEACELSRPGDGKGYKAKENAEEVWANARLIAAAPELLEALQMMLGCELMGGDQRKGLGPDKPGTSPVAKARAAIAKATGEGEA